MYTTYIRLTYINFLWDHILSYRLYCKAICQFLVGQQDKYLTNYCCLNSINQCVKIRKLLDSPVLIFDSKSCEIISIWCSLIDMNCGWNILTIIISCCKFFNLLGGCKYKINNMTKILYLHPPSKFKTYNVTIWVNVSFH